jgi:hypothetical protein
MGLMFAMLANNQGTIGRSDHPLLIPKTVKPPIPKGCKVWHEYGGVIALNEASAKRKYEKLKNNQNGI